MKVEILKKIHGSFSSASSKDVILFRRFDLPFLPVRGMCIRDQGWFSGELKEVTYSVSDEKVICYTENDKQIYNSFLHKEKPKDINEIVEVYTSSGWILEI